MKEMRREIFAEDLESLDSGDREAYDRFRRTLESFREEEGWIQTEDQVRAECSGSPLERLGRAIKAYFEG